jgi:hypothetical protein
MNNNLRIRVTECWVISFPSHVFNHTPRLWISSLTTSYDLGVRLYNTRYINSSNANNNSDIDRLMPDMHRISHQLRLLDYQ